MPSVCTLLYSEHRLRLGEGSVLIVGLKVPPLGVPYPAAASPLLGGDAFLRSPPTST